MTTEEIVDAARDAGFSGSEMLLRLPAFKLLIESAAAAEREACAQVCDRGAEQMLHAYKREGAARCAAAIRARSQK